jgi:hypothetical protein
VTSEIVGYLPTVELRLHLLEPMDDDVPGAVEFLDTFG